MANAIGVLETKGLVALVKGTDAMLKAANVSLAGPLKDSGGDAVVVSQFTLFGNMRKGSRPSFNRSAHPDTAVPLYEKFCELFEADLCKKIGRGEFGADMRVHLVNDGPVTIIADSRNRDI